MKAWVNPFPVIMITFTGFVIEAQHALPIDQIGQPILVVVPAAWYRVGELPYHPFHESMLADHDTLPQN